MTSKLGPFTVMDFLHDPEVQDPGVVYLEDLRRARWYEEAEGIADYRVVTVSWSTRQSRLTRRRT